MVPIAVTSAQPPSAAAALAEGTTFQTVLNDTRRAIAHRYLSEGHLSVAEIAFLLGYGEPSSFYRAFHAWTGRTPLDARAELGTRWHRP